MKQTRGIEGALEVGAVLSRGKRFQAEETVNAVPEARAWLGV